VLTMAVSRLVEVALGELVFGSGDTMIAGACVDSRETTSGCAFFSMPGERVDAHRFVAPALAAGARAAIVERWDEALESEVRGVGRPDVAVVKVASAGEALRALARYHRSRLHCPVVGITGSTGKTTTKDFLAAALGVKLQVVATSGNRNNEIGAPLTVLAAGSDTDVLVVEMGMRGPGQIAELCSLARPTLGLVTNIGQTHIELMGTQEAILHAKGELLACLPADGRAFLNSDDSWSRKLADTSPAPITWYGLGKDADVRATDVVVDEAGYPSVTLQAGGDSVRLALPVPGRHNAYTAAAAAAVALHLGLTLDEIGEGLRAAQVSGMRMQVFTAANGVTVINDAYNANPTSMRAAVVALADMKTGQRRVAVLGDMAELGSLTELAHFKLGEETARSGIEVLVTVGPRAAHIADGARTAGMRADSIRSCASADEASEVLDDLLGEGDIVLVKASRSMGLERVVEGIMAPHA
jgi:UDP-N-acetylmuramoyl-tripeptide--D-alanyl-D-alanine ligase